MVIVCIGMHWNVTILHDWHVRMGNIMIFDAKVTSHTIVCNVFIVTVVRNSMYVS